MGDIMNVYKMKKENEKLMKQYIDEIIMIKNDELFSFINQELAVDRWTSVNEKLDDVVEEYREVLTMYLQKINKSENTSRIEAANKQLSELIVTSKKKNANILPSFCSVSFCCILQLLTVTVTVTITIYI